MQHLRARLSRSLLIAAVASTGAITSAASAAAPRLDKRGEARMNGAKIELCHRKNRGGRFKSMMVPPSAVAAHLRHGDCVVADGDPCTLDFCDERLGCVNDPGDKSCNNDNVCDGIEICTETGECIPGEPLDCDDGNPCTDDLCDPIDGCYSEFNTAPCDDGDDCTDLDFCVSGECVGGAPAEERCDGSDSDCDGLVDCEDPDCDLGGACDLDVRFDARESFCSFASDCTGLASVPFIVDGGLPANSIVITAQLDEGDDGTIDRDVDTSTALSGMSPDYRITLRLPIGNHALLITAEDAAGNSDTARVPFEVADCKAPSPICINGLAIELMPVEPGTDADGDGDEDTGAMTVFASDFLASPIDDCSPPIRYSINRSGALPNIDDAGLVVTCDDPETLIIEIYAWDEALNADFCETYILVQDNMFDLCD